MYGTAATSRMRTISFLLGLALAATPARASSDEGWADLGNALAGTHGDPVLCGAGHLIPATPITLTLDNVLAGTTAFCAAGLTPANAPFKGGTFVPNPVLLFPVSTGGTPGTPSSVVLSDQLPADIPLGTELYLQCWIVDPSGPAGFAASNALLGTVRSLFDQISAQFDALLAAAGTPGSTKPVYWVQNFSTQTYTRNPNCWAASIDLTGMSPWNGTGGRTRAGTLISPRHIAFAKHYPISTSPGSNQVVFVTANNVTVTRSVVGVAYPGDDIGIGVLDSDVPPEISFHKILPGNWATHLPDVRRLPMLMLDQEEKALTRDMFLLSASCTHWAPIDPLRLSFHENLIGGDSGNPAFVVVGGEAVLVLTHFTTDYGPSYTWWRNQVNTAMTNLGGGHQLTEFDLDAYLQQ